MNNLQESLRAEERRRGCCRSALDQRRTRGADRHRSRASPMRRRGTSSNTGGSSVKSLVSGSNSTSRIIIRGVEDLGGGLTAGFHLEHGILLDAGAAVSATQFWDRRSTVSVTSPAWGELRLGRDFVPSYVSWTRYDPFSYVGVAGSNNLVSATPNGPIRSAFSTSPNTTVRSSNAIQWLTADTAGAGSRAA